MLVIIQKNFGLKFNSTEILVQDRNEKDTDSPPPMKEGQAFNSTPI